MKLERLIYWRDNILLCEIGTLMHDLGKLSIEFNEYQATESKRIAFEHEMIFERRENEKISGLPNSTVSKEDLAKSIEKLRSCLESLQLYDPLLSEDRKILSDKIVKDAIKNAIGGKFDELDNKGKPGEEGKRFLTENCKEGFTPRSFINDEIKNFLNTECICFLGSYLIDDKTISMPSLLQPDQSSCLGDYVDSNYLKKNGLRRILKNSDDKDSAGDKSSHGKDSTQDEPDFFGSTSFGLESLLDAEIIKNARYKFCNSLYSILGTNCAHSNVTGKWLDTHKYILESAKQAFSTAIAETRRSANDVSLWHHSYATASLLKSSIAELLLPDPPPQNLSGTWSILSINFNVLGLIEKAHRIGDILGYTEYISRNLCDAIKQVIEIDSPLGNEIYRDESGIYFTFPALDENLRNEIVKEIREILYSKEEVRSFDLPIHISVSKPSSFLTKIGEEIDKGYKKADFTTNEYMPEWVGHWSACNRSQGDGNQVRPFIYYENACKSEICKIANCIFRGGKSNPKIDRCPVCQVRPKCTHQEICISCSERRDRRLKDWLEDSEKEKNFPVSTIWLSEVADKNRHLALITAQFGLWNWFSGAYVDSLFSQSLLKERTALGKEITIHGTYNELIRDINNLIACFDPNAITPLLSQVIDDLQVTNGKVLSRYFKDYASINKFLTERDYRLSSICNEDSRKIAYALFCKYPVPSRLRRIWEGTKQFWDDTVSKEIFYNHFYNQGKSGDRYSRRLLLVPRSIMPDSMMDRHVYEVKFKGVVLSAIWLERITENGGFLVIDNLSKIPGMEYSGALKDKFLNTNLECWDKDRNENLFNTCVNAEWADEKFSSYLPAITIHASPLSFMAVVPAQDAIEITRQIRNEYEIQFGKVANRLPLDIGIIFFDEKFPLYVAIDGARRMMEGFKAKQQNAKLTDSRWKIVRINKCQKENIELTLAREDDAEKCHHLVRKVSVELGDKNKTDVFYPYFPVFSPTESELDTRGRNYFLWPDEDNKWQPLVHVSHLMEGDTVGHLESHFDFEFLNSISAISNLNFDENGNRVEKTRFRSKRGWNLHQINEIEKLFEIFEQSELTITQINQLREALISALNRWQLTTDSSPEQDNVFREFAKATLVRAGDSAFWRSIHEEDKTWLIESCANGFLFDVLELYLEVFKEKVVKS